MLILIGLISLIAATIGPRRLWWSLQSWSYSDPEANEPSDAAFGVERFVLVAVSIVMLVFGLATVGDPAPGSPEAKVAAAEKAASKGSCEAVMTALRDGDVRTRDRDETKSWANTVLEDFGGKVDMIRGTSVVDFVLPGGVKGTYGSANDYEEGC